VYGSREEAHREPSLDGEEEKHRLFLMLKTEEQLSHKRTASSRPEATLDDRGVRLKVFLMGTESKS
jgi:hypothetical protein